MKTLYNSNLPALKLNISYPRKIIKELKNLSNKYFVNQLGNSTGKEQL